MHTNKSTLKASTVYAYAYYLLMVSLELDKFQPVLPLQRVGCVLLLAACWQTSLSGACLLVQDKPDHRVIRRMVYACLPPRPRDLLARLLLALRQAVPDHLGRVPRVAVIDLHQRPYYGKGTTRGCTHRQKKASTRKSFTYATLAVLSREGRFTIGLLPTRPTMRWTTIVAELLAQAKEAGISISYLLLDKDFYSAEVVALLQKEGVPFLMPAEKRGKPGTTGGNQHLFAAATAVGWYDYTWTAPLRRWDFKAKKRKKRGEITVTVRMCVARQPRTGEPLVYASSGLGSWPPAAVVQEYRRRFGIEVQYRQLGQCLARTSSANERYRLLLIGLALLMCNLWAWLHSELFSTGPLGQRQLHLPLLRLPVLIASVAAHVASLLGGYVEEWLVQPSVPQRLMPLLD